MTIGKTDRSRPHCVSVGSGILVRSLYASYQRETHACWRIAAKLRWLLRDACADPHLCTPLLRGREATLRAPRHGSALLPLFMSLAPAGSRPSLAVHPLRLWSGAARRRRARNCLFRSSTRVELNLSTSECTPGFSLRLDCPDAVEHELVTFSALASCILVIYWGCALRRDNQT